jgi:hypothetical protein
MKDKVSILGTIDPSIPVVSMTAGGIPRQLTCRRQLPALGNISDIPDEVAIRVAKLWPLNSKLEYILVRPITRMQECSRRAYRHTFYACDR